MKPRLQGPLVRLPVDLAAGAEVQVPGGEAVDPQGTKNLLTNSCRLKLILGACSTKTVLVLSQQPVSKYNLGTFWGEFLVLYLVSGAEGAHGGWGPGRTHASKGWRDPC